MLKNLDNFQEKRNAMYDAVDKKDEEDEENLKTKYRKRECRCKEIQHYYLLTIYIGNKQKKWNDNSN